MKIFRSIRGGGRKEEERRVEGGRVEDVGWGMDGKGVLLEVGGRGVGGVGRADFGWGMKEMSDGLEVEVNGKMGEEMGGVMGGIMGEEMGGVMGGEMYGVLGEVMGKGSSLWYLLLFLLVFAGIVGNSLVCIAIT